MKYLSFEERIEEHRKDKIQTSISTKHVKVFVANSRALQALSQRSDIDFTLFLAFLIGMWQNNMLHMSAKMLAEMQYCCPATAKKRIKAFCDAGLMKKTKTRDVYMVNPFLAIHCDEEDIATVRAIWDKATTIYIEFIDSTEEQTKEE